MTADDETQDLPSEAPLPEDEQELPLEDAEQAEPSGYSIPPGEE